MLLQLFRHGCKQGLRQLLEVRKVLTENRREQPKPERPQGGGGRAETETDLARKAAGTVSCSFGFACCSQFDRLLRVFSHKADVRVLTHISVSGLRLNVAHMCVLRFHAHQPRKLKVPNPTDPMPPKPSKLCSLWQPGSPMKRLSTSWRLAGPQSWCPLASRLEPTGTAACCGCAHT